MKKLALPLSTAVPDLNGDGRSDRCAGVPGEALGGGMKVLNGIRRGIGHDGDRLLTRANPGLPLTAAAGNRFGQALLSMGRR